MDPVRAIADAVLYEGYLLWPYRRSATKNQRRWTFGGVYPQAHSERASRRPLRRCAPSACSRAARRTSTCRVRFLHVVARQVLRDGEPVDELRRRRRAPPLLGRGGRARADRRAAGRVPIAIAAGAEEEALAGGAIVRSWEALAGSVEVRAEPVARRRPADRGRDREHDAVGRRGRARRRCGARSAPRTRSCARRDGAFVSQTDPPERLRAAAAACRNDGAWPVLVERTTDTVLASPIILEDHPRIAPESPGDLFDGGEIDQMLVLNILSLTDEEKAEMRDSDPRAREILERTEALTEEELMRAARRDPRVRAWRGELGGAPAARRPSRSPSAASSCAAAAACGCARARAPTCSTSCSPGELARRRGDRGGHGGQRAPRR